VTVEGQTPASSGSNRPHLPHLPHLQLSYGGDRTEYQAFMSRLGEVGQDPSGRRVPRLGRKEVHGTSFLTGSS
jgi:hypothetical protein